MIVKSVHGPVDISKPENVVRGMVFDHDGEPRVAVVDGCRESAGRSFLGCHPIVAARGDCERFGLAPSVDAGAHGFARTREGFAVDTQRPESLPPGTVGERENGTRWMSPVPTGLLLSRFLGLDARYASVADVARLCCGAVFHDDHGGCGERCSLAIGNHAEHEDLSSGVKWAATNAPTRAGVTWTYPDAGAVVGVDRAMVPTFAVLLREHDGVDRPSQWAGVPAPMTGVRVVVIAENEAVARNVRRRLEALGGRREGGGVTWPGGSWIRVVTGEGRGLRADVVVGGDPDSTRCLLSDPWSLGIRVPGEQWESFFGVGARSVAASGAPRYSGNVRSADTSSRLADSLEETGFVGSATLAAAVMADIPRGKMVMAGTPWRTSPDLLYADAVGAAQIGGVRADFVAVDEVPSGPRRVRVLVRDDETLRSDTPAGARTIVRLAAPDLSESEVDKVTDYLTHRRPRADGASLRESIEVVLGAKVFSSGHAQSPPIDPRRAAWIDDVTRRMLETRKAAASETATKHNAEALLLSKALRSALADVDRLPWDLADRKPLRAAAHALCEMAEAATDGMGHDGPKLRPMLGEMLGILRAAALLPPATAAGMAERTLGAARKAMPRRQK